MPIERPHDAPLGMPSPEALQMATDAIHRCYDRNVSTTLIHPGSAFRLGSSALTLVD